MKGQESGGKKKRKRERLSHFIRSASDDLHYGQNLEVLLVLHYTIQN